MNQAGSASRPVAVGRRRSSMRNTCHSLKYSSSVGFCEMLSPWNSQKLLVRILLLYSMPNVTSIFNRLEISRQVCTSIPHFSSRWNWKKLLGVSEHALVSGAQNIGLSNHKLKSALKCTVWSQCTPVPERQTDRRTNIMMIAQRFVLTNSSRAKN